MTKPQHVDDSTFQDPAQRSVLPDLTGYLMKRALMVLHRDLKATLDAFDLTQRTFSVLAIVVANPDINQSDVAASLAMERSGTVVIVDTLEQRDLIRRAPMPGDRRAYALRATLQGLRFFDTVLAAVHAHEERMLAALSDEEQAQLSTLLTRLTDMNPPA